MKNRHIVLSAVGGLLAVSMAVQPVEADTLRVGKAFGGSFAFALVDVGVSAGIFEKHGLDLEVSAFGGGAKLQQALAAGSLDIGLSTGTDMALILKGAPVKAVASVVSAVDQVIVVGPNAAIASVDDLKGKSFAASSPVAMSGWLPLTLSKRNGWGEDGAKLQIVNSGGAAMAMLKTGEVDAMTLDPVNALAGEKAGDMKVIYHLSDMLPSFPQYAIYATDDAIASKPDAVKAFLAGWFETVEYARSHKAEALPVFAATIGTPEDVVEGVYDELVGNYSASGKFEPEGMDVLLTSFVDNEVLPEKPAVDAVSTEQFLP